MNEPRERILGCACELYLDHGLDGFSMRKLASEVGVTAPALYRHYESKEKVLVDVVGEAFKVFASYLHRALEGDSASVRFRLTGEGYLAFALEHPRYYEMLHASPSLLGLEELPREAAAQACATGQFMVDRVREAMDAGMLKEGDPTAVARTIWAHSHGMISIYLRGLVPMDEEDFRAFFMESAWRLMEGIATPEFVEAEGPPVTRARSTASAPETGLRAIEWKDGPSQHEDDATDDD